MRRSLAIVSAILVTGTVLMIAPSVAFGAESTYNYSGTTPNNGDGVPHTATCASGYYVENTGTASGSVFDSPYIDTTGTASGVSVGHGVTASEAWGHVGSRVVTGIEVWAQNDQHHRHSSLHYSITVKCTNNRGDAWVIVGATPGVAASTTATSYNFSGSTNSNGDGKSHEVGCASGYYVKNSGTASGSVFDSPYIDTTGTASGVSVGHGVTTSDAWGHIGSRLATGIELWAQNDQHHRHSSLPFSITVQCTNNTGDAWLIAG